ncbi:DUF1289 domain-containing protein [Vineibacter terrae]|uniref:DUF1289 domain-containing protein n=1 Tax=Vineibacter terrae TaxID=2586908 RepID=A0A5C8PKG1_9HYPH|nr:DUF1289 domain-containing protein [Vineibacter terrae]TXL74393.1 DUF1289 domain-containing protein [Vineibacter terrae]
MTDPAPRPQRRPIVSPCVSVCIIDPQSGLCRGCKRTLDEISRWVVMTDEQRLAVLEALPGRPDPTKAA